LGKLGRRFGRKGTQEDASTPVLREVTKEIEPTKVEEYFAPADSGRPRVIVMISEDGKSIEPVLFTKMSALQASSHILRAGTAQLAQQIQGLEAEIEFLREKLNASQPPPVDPIHPAPFALPEAVD
jgi:hypothetical protein